MSQYHYQDPEQLKKAEGWDTEQWIGVQKSLLNEWVRPHLPSYKLTVQDVLMQAK